MGRDKQKQKEYMKKWVKMSKTKIFICEYCKKEFKDNPHKERRFCCGSCKASCLNKIYHFKSGIGIYRKFIKKKKCEKCGNNEKLMIHHKNHNRFDNSLNNLQVLCFRCHTLEHNFLSHFKEAYKKNKRNKYGRFGDEKPLPIIRCICCKKETEKHNSRQKYCKNCSIKLNIGHKKNG